MNNKQITKIRKIVNLIRELAEYNGAYSPTRYLHYLPIKKTEFGVKVSKIEL